MLVFSPLLTRRLSLQLAELTFDDAISLCGLPAHLVEAGIGKMLGRVASQVTDVRPGVVTNPALWTVQERGMAMAHYTSHVADDGPDFSIGQNASFADYLLEGVNDYVEDGIALGEFAGESWRLHHLLGAHAEAVESLMLSGQLPPKRLGWILGCMALQLASDGVPQPDPLDGAALKDHIRQQAATFGKLPESDMAALVECYLSRLPDLDHLLRLVILDDGPAFLPTKGGRGELPPARFPVAPTIGEFTKTIFGKAE